jgi:hypothetical protein
VPTEDVRKWNHMKTNHVSRGMVLRIYTVGGAPEIAPEHSRSKTSSKAHASPQASTYSQAAATHN